MNALAAFDDTGYDVRTAAARFCGGRRGGRSLYSWRWAELLVAGHDVRAAHPDEVYELYRQGL